MAGSNEPSDDLVEIGRVFSVIEADVVRASLEAAGIPAFVPGALATNMLSHMAGGLNPNGMKVLVRAASADDARELIAAWHASKADRREGEAAPDQVEETPADVWARSAWRSAILTLVSAMIFLPLAIYCLRRARREAKLVEPADRPAFERHIVGACLVIGIAVLCYAIIAWMLLSSIWDRGPSGRSFGSRTIHIPL